MDLDRMAHQRFIPGLWHAARSQRPQRTYTEITSWFPAERTAWDNDRTAPSPGGGKVFSPGHNCRCCLQHRTDVGKKISVQDILKRAVRCDCNKRRVLSCPVGNSVRSTVCGSHPITFRGSGGKDSSETKFLLRFQVTLTIGKKTNSV